MREIEGGRDKGIEERGRHSERDRGRERQIRQKYSKSDRWRETERGESKSEGGGGATSSTLECENREISIPSETGD